MSYEKTEPTTSRTLSPATKGRIFLLLAAVLWSLSGAIVKSRCFENIPTEHRATVLAFYRTVFAAAILALFVRRKQISYRTAMIPMCISFASMNFLYITALTMTTAAAAIFLQYTSTVWAFLFGLIFWKEAINRGSAIALIFAIVGIVTIVSGDWNGKNFSGNLMGLGSGLTYAGVILSLKYLHKENATWLILLNHIAAAIALLPLMLISGWWSIDIEQFVWVAILGMLVMAVPYILFARGVGTLSMQEAALIPLLEPILNPLWVLIFWGEQASSQTWLGGSLILVGMAIKYYFFMPKEIRLAET